MTGESGQSAVHLGAPGRPPSPVALWRQRRFALLWLADATGELGPQIVSIAVPLLAVNALHASSFAISALTALAWLPYLYFSLPAGVIADRFHRLHVLVFCNVVRVLLLALVPITAALDMLTLWLLMIDVSLIGAATVLFQVAYRSVLPSLVAAEDLVDANGKLAVSSGLAELVGPALAGALSGAIGASKTLLVNVGALVVSTVCLAMIHRPGNGTSPRSGPAPRKTTNGAADAGAESLWEQMLLGLGFVRRNQILRSILVCTCVSNFFVMASTAVEIVYLVRTLNSSSTTVGVVYACGAVGGLLAGALANTVTNRIGSARIIWLSMTVPGPIYLLAAFAEPGWRVGFVAISLAALAANVTFFNASGTAYRQRVCPPELLSRVNATFMWITYSVIPLGALAGGVVASGLGARAAIAITAVGMWAAGLFVYFSPLRVMRELPLNTSA